MANPDHVELVSMAAAALAEWRQKHPRGVLDLSGADLSGVNLIQADLSWADLRESHLSRATLRWAYLRGAYLREANLSEANLSGADLRGANLSGADVLGANLSGADLREADLREADLSGADLRWADLRRADLDSALFWETGFGDTKLTGAHGLKSMRHLGPSIMDERTLRRSWPLPETFLRGCGLSDELISFLGATLGKETEFYSCFISYSSKDQAFAQRLHNDLQGKGVRCWFAPKDLPIGAKQREFIDESIRVHEKLLLVLSEHSVKSSWVEKEVATAIETHEKTGRSALFPIRLDDAVMQIAAGWPADVRRIWNIGDFRRWEEHGEYQQAFGRLLRDLKSERGEADGA